MLEIDELPISGLQYPIDIKNPSTFTIEGFINSLKQDSVLRDSIMFPGLPPLFPFQKAIFKVLDQYDNVWFQACRGLAKSYTVGRWCAGTGLVHKARFVYTGPTFRQSKKPWKYARECIEQGSDENYVLHTGNEIEGKPSESTEMAKLFQKNATEHVALPMGSGQNIRGERANVLVADEFFNIERNMYRSHILPFLQGHKEPGSISKLILMTSAEWQDTYAYFVYTSTFIAKMKEEDELVKLDPTYKRKYAIIDLRIEDAESEGYTVNWDVINQMLEGASEEEREQALHNKWIGNSGAFIPSNLVDKMECSQVTIEYKAERGYDYCASVDVATQIHGDLFIIHVWKMTPPGGMDFVHTVWGQGLTEDEMAWEIHKLD